MVENHGEFCNQSRRKSLLFVTQTFLAMDQEDKIKAPFFHYKLKAGTHNKLHN